MTNEGDDKFMFWIEIGFKADEISYIRWNSQQCYVAVPDIHLAWFQYANFDILINHCTEYVMYLQMCVEEIWAISASSANDNEHTAVAM